MMSFNVRIENNAKFNDCIFKKKKKNENVYSNFLFTRSFYNIFFHFLSKLYLAYNIIKVFLYYILRNL